MPKVVPAEELNRIADLIGQHPDGIGLDGISVIVGNAISRRTLQRRLAALVAQGRIVTSGGRRGLKYRLAPIVGHAAILQQDQTLSAAGEVYVPVSAEGESIKAYVRQPRTQRRPVSYNQAFLEDYHPNQTHYLPEVLRKQLHALGRSPVEQAPAGTFARDIMNRLLIDLSWASSRLEGNTYSRLDTERLIAFGQAAEGKDALETQMILNHKLAIEYLVTSADGVGINVPTMLALHALLSDGLLPDPHAGGRVRDHAVEIGGSTYLPIALPQRLEDLFGVVVHTASEIRDPFEQAFFLMAHLPYLQPFADVNKRVSRLAANIPLFRENLCPLSFIDVPERAYVDAVIGVYELNRVELLRDVFVWAYERSCQHYVAVRQQLVPPDTFRLRHRAEVSEVVRAIVHGGQRVSETAILSAIPATIVEGDRDRFVALIRDEFKSLHEGNAIRFGLRPLEFAAWSELVGQASGRRI
jgi:hypothetical protein